MERERTIPVEKKLRLVQLLRSEDEENRSRMQRREELLYGKSSYYQEEMQDDMSVTPAFSSLKLRFLIAFLLMIGFVSWDYGYYKVPGITTEQVYEALNVENSITNLFAFTDNMPDASDTE